MDAIQPDRQIGWQPKAACPAGRDPHAQLIDLSEECFTLAAGMPPRIKRMLRCMAYRLARVAGQEAGH